MHAAKICTKNYANGKKSQVDTTWRSRLLIVNRVYQQLSSLARPHSARTQPARRLRPARTYQSTHNR